MYSVYYNILCVSIEKMWIHRKFIGLYDCRHEDLKFKSNARETWCVILVSESWHILLRITAHPRGAFISVGDWTPTEKDLLLLTTCRSGSLNSDWDEPSHCINTGLQPEVAQSLTLIGRHFPMILYTEIRQIQECFGILAARCVSCNYMTHFYCAPLQSCRSQSPSWYKTMYENG